MRIIKVVGFIALIAGLNQLINAKEEKITIENQIGIQEEFRYLCELDAVVCEGEDSPSEYVEGKKPTIIAQDNVPTSVQADVVSLIRQEFGDEADIAIAVMMAESRGNEQAIGDTHLSKPSYGLFQISRIYHNYPVEVLLNPIENIKIAKQIRDSGGWSRWTTYRNGNYLAYLK